MTNSIHFPNIPQTLANAYSNMGYKNLKDVPSYIRLPYEYLLEPALIRPVQAIIDAPDLSTKIVNTCSLAAAALSAVSLAKIAYASPANGALGLAGRVTGLPLLALAPPIELPSAIEPFLDPHVHFEIPEHDVRPLPPEILIGPIATEILREIIG